MRGPRGTFLNPVVEQKQSFSAPGKFQRDSQEGRADKTFLGQLGKVSLSQELSLISLSCLLVNTVGQRESRCSGRQEE